MTPLPALPRGEGGHREPVRRAEAALPPEPRAGGAGALQGRARELLADYGLTAEEREAFVAGDVGKLYVLGANGQLLMHFAALLGMPWAEYIEAMREGMRRHGPVRGRHLRDDHFEDEKVAGVEAFAMSLVFAGVCSHAPGITGRAQLADPGVRDAFYAAFGGMREALEAATPDALWSSPPSTSRTSS